MRKNIVKSWFINTVEKKKTTLKCGSTYFISILIQTSLFGFTHWITIHWIQTYVMITVLSTRNLPHCRRILYHLSHQGSPRILEWAAYPFSSRSCWPRNRTGDSCIAGGCFTSWATKQAIRNQKYKLTPGQFSYKVLSKWP